MWPDEDSIGSWGWYQRSALFGKTNGAKDSLGNLPCPALSDEPWCIVQIRNVENVQSFSAGQADIPRAWGDGQRANGLIH